VVPTADNEMRAAKTAPACGSGVLLRTRHPRTRLAFSARGGSSERAVARRALPSPSPSPNAPPPPPDDGASERGASRRALASPSPSPSAPPPQPAPVRVIYEDDDLLAVDKPCGMSFHSDDLEGVEEGSNEKPAPGLLAVIRAAQENGSLVGSDYVGPLHSVHRLDKVTSGITLFAKTPVAAAHLSEQFRLRRVHKYYVALSAKRPKKKMGTVSGEMTRARRGAWRLVKRPSKDERDGARNDKADDDSVRVTRVSSQVATTKFSSRGLLKPKSAERDSRGGRDETKKNARALRFFVLRPLTGRTHQLRVACKSLGAPILGDALYAGKEEARKEDRAYLHAAAVRVALPVFTGNAAEGAGLKRNRRGDDDEMSLRIVSVVCKPSFGIFWSDSASFDEAWDDAGFGSMERGDHDVWFEGQALLRSSASELLR
jgi:tRNA pseudouridine32 synthase/23S rRNA pseudouridine746 synthase